METHLALTIPGVDLTLTEFHLAQFAVVMLCFAILILGCSVVMSVGPLRTARASRFAVLLGILLLTISIIAALHS